MVSNTHMHPHRNATLALRPIFREMEYMMGGIILPKNAAGKSQDVLQT